MRECVRSVGLEEARPGRSQASDWEWHVKKLARKVEARPHGALWTCQGMLPMKALQGFKHDHMCISTMFSFQPTSLIALSSVAWSLDLLTIVSTHIFPLPPAFTETWLSPRDSAFLPALLFQFPALLLSPLYQLDSDSPLLPFPSSSINSNDFMTHLCLLVLVCFFGMSSVPPQSYSSPTTCSSCHHPE